MFAQTLRKPSSSSAQTEMEKVGQERCWGGWLRDGCSADSTLLLKEGNCEKTNQKTHHDIYKFRPLRGGRSRWYKLHLEIEEKKHGMTKADGWVGREVPPSTENKPVEEAADNGRAVNQSMVLAACPHAPTSGYPRSTRDQPAKHLGWLLQP